MTVPFCKRACHIGQVEGVHAGVSLPGCLWPHTAGDGRGMSLVHCVESAHWLQGSGYSTHTKFHRFLHVKAGMH